MFNDLPYKEKVIFNALEATHESRDAKIHARFNDDLASSNAIPLIFNETKNESSKVSIDEKTLLAEFAETSPLLFNLAGGEKLEIGRYSKPSFLGNGIDYGMTWKVTGFKPKFSDEKDFELQEHPWIVLKHSMKIRPVIVGNNPLDASEEAEILRWMALFNPKNILLDDIEFKLEDYPKLVVLQAFGRSVTEKSSDKFSNEKLKSFDDVCDLFNEEDLKSLFGAEYKKWVHDILVTAKVIGGDLVSWPVDLIKSIMLNPVSEEELTVEEIQNIVHFIEKNNIAIKIGTTSRGEEYVTNPSLVKKISEFPDEE